MLCPNCQFKNPQGMNFCGKCGTPLPKVCQACGFENPPDFRICGKCGEHKDSYSRFDPGRNGRSAGLPP
ncbi:MAG TPA: zinc-ribbon domain-containing protein [Desulfobacterales bacterium]|nr:zinc-ribbon domain-containing protein [Desulfobacterales bacterium]